MNIIKGAWKKKSLCKEVSDAEILAAVNHLGPLKAPGKDEFPGFFFRKYWDIVCTHVCSLFRIFLPPVFYLHH